MKITIEKRTNKAGDKQSIRLVYWYNSRRNDAGKVEHDRRNEPLNLYLHTTPSTKFEKQNNKETLQLVEQIKSKRIAEAASGQHDSVAFRFIAANLHPDHDTLANFRKTFLVALEDLFVLAPIEN